MQTTRRVLAVIGMLWIVWLSPPPARADAPGKEVWIGVGVSWPDYHELAMACVRCGVGAVLVDHVTLGASVQGDRDRFHYFADAGLILPLVWHFEPYARFQIGRRDDRDDTATGWAAGFRVGEEAVRFFVEVHGIVEPEENHGVSAGISF
jgi:hypothetical protein